PGMVGYPDKNASIPGQEPAHTRTKMGPYPDKYVRQPIYDQGNDQYKDQDSDSDSLTQGIGLPSEPSARKEASKEGFSSEVKPSPWRTFTFRWRRLEWRAAAAPGEAESPDHSGRKRPNGPGDAA